jgi:hypothetical protein
VPKYFLDLSKCFQINLNQEHFNSLKYVNEFCITRERPNFFLNYNQLSFKCQTLLLRNHFKDRLDVSIFVYVFECVCVCFISKRKLNQNISLIFTLFYFVTGIVFNIY